MQYSIINYDVYNCYHSYIYIHFTTRNMNLFNPFTCFGPLTSGDHSLFSISVSSSIFVSLFKNTHKSEIIQYFISLSIMPSEPIHIVTNDKI